MNFANPLQMILVLATVRGVQAVPLRCGTERWGFNHIVLRGRWTAAFDAQITHTIARGTVSRDKTVYARFNKDCEELFRIIVNPNAIYGDGFSPQGIITAYPIVGTMMGTSSRSGQDANGGPCLVTEPVDGTGSVAGREVDA